MLYPYHPPLDTPLGSTDFTLQHYVERHVAWVSRWRRQHTFRPFCQKTDTFDALECLSTTLWLCRTLQDRSESQRSSVAERTLCRVGRGVTLSVDRSAGTVWLYNRSDVAVFVLSPTTSPITSATLCVSGVGYRNSSTSAVTPMKLLPAQTACIYRWTDQTCKLTFFLLSSCNFF